MLRELAVREDGAGKEMILTRGSGRAVRGGGDAHGLDCGRLTGGAGLSGGAGERDWALAGRARAGGGGRAREAEGWAARERVGRGWTEREAWVGPRGKTGSRAKSWAERAVRENWLGQCAGPKREKERAD